jgi:hypothetical protein
LNQGLALFVKIRQSETICMMKMMILRLPSRGSFLNSTMQNKTETGVPIRKITSIVIRAQFRPIEILAIMKIEKTKLNNINPMLNVSVILTLGSITAPTIPIQIDA